MLTADVFTEECRSHFGAGVEKHLIQIEEMAAHSIGMSTKFSAANDVAWRSQYEADRHTTHNRWVNVLYSAYSRKNAIYLNALINALNRFDYLSYAMSARSLIETTATLRYYIVNKYESLMRSEPVDLDAIIAVHEVHFHGKRFDWGAFLEGDFESLIVAANSSVQAKTKQEKQKLNEELKEKIGAAQTNTTTFIEKWAKDDPSIMVSYGVLCDLVHPNFGSNFVVSSFDNDRVLIGSDSGHPFGKAVVEKTLPWLLAAYKEFGKRLLLLVSMKYSEDELLSSKRSRH